MCLNNDAERQLAMHAQANESMLAERYGLNTALRNALARVDALEQQLIEAYASFADEYEQAFQIVADERAARIAAEDAAETLRAFVRSFIEHDALR